MKLELPKNLPDTVGVRALVEILERAELDLTLSLGKICGSKVAAVALGDSLEVYSVTLEPFELENVDIARAKALAFVAELEVQHFKTLEN
jgi:hypothetical protein